MKNILITQCLQNDFVQPLIPGEPLPNKLHIGHNESRRLIGENIRTGPLGHFMAWADSQPASQLTCIHIRDWHDPNCPQQASHLKQFNAHCIQNTQGAEFIFNSILSNNISTSNIINSTTLNDFIGTSLKKQLDKLSSNTSPETSQRVGIIGVWTEAKVLFLAYELATRYPHLEIAVSSALTVSSSRSQYLIRYLFRDCQKISLKILDGGFSGNLVAGIKSIDMHGHEQTPHVIKVGPRDLMARERTSFEQIETVLGNNAPAIAEYADAQHNGAIKYRYASMGVGNARSLQQCFQNNEAPDKLHNYIKAVLHEQPGRLYRASVNETHDLLQYYCFDSSWAESVKNKISELIGHCPDTGNLNLPGNITAHNLYLFYKEELDTLASTIADYPFSFVHGDLNGANIIIDNRDNVWIIDFFHTHRGHVLKDFAKLENDLLYIYTPVNNERDLGVACQFTDFLLSLDEYPATNPATNQALPEMFINTQFERAFSSLCVIRKIARQQISDNSPSPRLQWLIPQLRYAVHTIGFDEPSRLQRIWALYTASKITETFIHKSKGQSCGFHG